MLETFLKAAIPEPVACCGVRLLPFSLGRLFALKRFCPAYLEGEKREFAALLTSCLICSQTYQQTIDTFSGRVDDADKYLKAWVKKLGKNKQFNFLKSSALFDKYIAEAMSPFPVVKAKAQEGFSSSDASLWPFIALMGCMKSGQTMTEAFEQPIALSRWIVAGYGTIEGGVEIIDGDQLKKDMQRAAEFEAELKRKGML